MNKLDKLRGKLLASAIAELFDEEISVDGCKRAGAKFRPAGDKIDYPHTLSQMWYRRAPANVSDLADQISRVNHEPFEKWKAALEDLHEHGPGDIWDVFCLPSRLRDPGVYGRSFSFIQAGIRLEKGIEEQPTKDDRLEMPRALAKMAAIKARAASTFRRSIRDPRRLKSVKIAIQAWFSSLEYYCLALEMDEIKRAAHRWVNPFLLGEEIDLDVLDESISPKSEADACLFASMKQLCITTSALPATLGIKPKDILEAAWNHAWDQIETSYPSSMLPYKESLESLIMEEGPDGLRDVITGKAKAGSGRGNKKVSDEHILRLYRAFGDHPTEIQRELEKEGEEISVQGVSDRIQAIKKRAMQSMQP